MLERKKIIFIIFFLFFNYTHLARKRFDTESYKICHSEIIVFIMSLLNDQNVVIKTYIKHAILAL